MVGVGGRAVLAVKPVWTRSSAAACVCTLVAVFPFHQLEWGILSTRSSGAPFLPFLPFLPPQDKGEIALKRRQTGSLTGAPPPKSPRSHCLRSSQSPNYPTYPPRGTSALFFCTLLSSLPKIHLLFSTLFSLPSSTFLFPPRTRSFVVAASRPDGSAASVEPVVPSALRELPQLQQARSRSELESSSCRQRT